MAKLSDYFVIADNSEPHNWTYDILDKYRLRIFTDEGYYIRPNIEGQPIDTYTHLTVSFVYKLSNKCWAYISKTELEELKIHVHTEYVPVELLPVEIIIQAIELLKIKAGVIETKKEFRELPCKVCKRMNDIGVNECYLCGTKNPTE